MDEIFQVCDTVTVLKDGRLAGTKSTSDTTPSSLVRMMVGRELGDLFPARLTHEGIETALRISNTKIDTRAKPFSLAINRGEIVGLAGLEGQGQQITVRSLVG